MNLLKNINISGFFGLESSADEADGHSLFEKKESHKQAKKTSHASDRQSKNTDSFNLDSSTTDFSEEAKNEKVVSMTAYHPAPDKIRPPENKKVSNKITVYEPLAYSDCKTIAQALLRKEVVIVTFSSMEEHQAKRVVDFLTGTVYALEGDIQRIGAEIFLCTPTSVEIDSTVAKSLITTHLADY